jgi:hypothetical protein
MADGSLALAVALGLAIIAGVVSKSDKYQSLRVSKAKPQENKRVRYWFYQPASQLIYSPYLKRGSLRARVDNRIRRQLYGTATQNAYIDGSGVPVKVYGETNDIADY